MTARKASKGSRKRKPNKSSAVPSEFIFDPKRVHEIVSNAALQLVRLQHVEAHLGNLKDGELPEHVGQSAKLEIRRKPGENTIVARFFLGVHAAYDEDAVESGEIDDVQVFVHATYELFFDVSIDGKIEDEYLAALGGQVGFLAVWPYWRELVQSMTQRMGLPSMTIPLHKVVSSE